MNNEEIKREAIELGVYYKMNGVITQRKLSLYDEMLGDDSPINAVAKRNLRTRLDELDKTHEYIVAEIKRLEAIVGIKSGIVKEWLSET